MLNPSRLTINDSTPKEKSQWGSPLESALGYASMGYPVIPITPGGKSPHEILTGRGLYAASSNPYVITSWFKTRLDANLAIIPPVGAVVFDFDDRDKLEEFLKRYPSLQKAPRSRTPRGGHVWAGVPDGVILRTRPISALIPQFELKKPLRGYVLEYPSKTPGGVYVWEIPLKPVDELPPVPPHLLNALRVKETPMRISNRTTLERTISRFRQEALPGNRHNALVAAATRLFSMGAPLEYVYRLKDLAIQAGLSEYEVDEVIRWARKRLNNGGKDD